MVFASPHHFVQCPIDIVRVSRNVSFINNFYLQEAEEECIDGYSVHRKAGVGDVIRAEYDEQNGKNVEMDLQSRVIERNRKAD